MEVFEGMSKVGLLFKGICFGQTEGSKHLQMMLISVCLAHSTKPLKLTRWFRLTSKVEMYILHSCHGNYSSMTLVYVCEIPTSGPDVGTSHAYTRVAVPLTPHTP